MKSMASSALAASCCFSSRRRHTRYRGDWSSDVCSSDLAGAHGGIQVGRAVARHRTQHGGCVRRSEERRVGEEWRSRWSPHHSKKKKLTDNFVRFAAVILLVEILLVAD